MDAPRGADRGLEAGVGLLEGALDYTRAALAPLDRDPAADLLTRRTPCREWDLDRLLAHMQDGLDAFAEGSGGTVSLASRPAVPLPVRLRVQRLRSTACDLLGAWSRGASPTARVGVLEVPTVLLARTAALEVAVHGWDVAATLGLDAPLPDTLARPLRDVAAAVVDPADRIERFAPPCPTGDGADATTRLLAFLGRDRSRPIATNPGVRSTGQPPAS